MADKLKYAIGNSSSTTLSGSVANDDTTMTITSDTNFAAKEGEGMIIVDEGTATEEFAYSTGKTGTTLTTPLANRGLEGGEAKAHDANATVKGIITATMWNDVIDSLANVVSKTTGALDTTKIVDLTTAQTLTNKTLTSPKINDTSSDHQYVVAVNELAADRTVTLPLLTGNDEFVFKDHTQTLTNKVLTSPEINTQITGTAIATGAEVTTGTDDTQIVTPKALGDAGVNTRLKSKAYTVTRDMTAASGDVSYTTIGFTPTAIYCIATISGVVANSIGFCDSSLQEYCMLRAADGNSYLLPNAILKVESSGGNAQSALVKSFDADGFTLTWTKINSATGTLSLQFLCFR